MVLENQHLWYAGTSTNEVDQQSSPPTGSSEDNQQNALPTAGEACCFSSSTPIKEPKCTMIAATKLRAIAKHRLYFHPLCSAAFSIHFRNMYGRNNVQPGARQRCFPTQAKLGDAGRRVQCRDNNSFRTTQQIISALLYWRVEQYMAQLPCLLEPFDSRPSLTIVFSAYLEFSTAAIMSLWRSPSTSCTLFSEKIVDLACCNLLHAAKEVVIYTEAHLLAYENPA